MTVEFFYPMEPPRGTWQGRRFWGLHQRGRAAKSVWQAVLEKYKPNLPLEGALTLEVQFVFPHTRESKKRAGSAAVVPKTTRPDSDNLVKMLLDVAGNLGYYHDDAQIFDLRVKRYFGDLPGLYFRLDSVPDAE